MVCSATPRSRGSEPSWGFLHEGHGTLWDHRSTQVANADRLVLGSAVEDSQFLDVAAGRPCERMDACSCDSKLVCNCFEDGASSAEAALRNLDVTMAPGIQRIILEALASKRVDETVADDRPNMIASDRPKERRTVAGPRDGHVTVAVSSMPPERCCTLVSGKGEPPDRFTFVDPATGRERVWNRSGFPGFVFAGQRADTKLCYLDLGIDISWKWVPGKGGPCKIEWWEFRPGHEGKPGLYKWWDKDGWNDPYTQLDPSDPDASDVLAEPARFAAAVAAGNGAFRLTDSLQLGRRKQTVLIVVRASSGCESGSDMSIMFAIEVEETGLTYKVRRRFSPKTPGNQNGRGDGSGPGKPRKPDLSRPDFGFDWENLNPSPAARVDWPPPGGR